MNKKWTEDEVNYIISFCGSMSDKELQRSMEERFQHPVNLNNLRKKRQRLGFKKSQGRNNHVIPPTTQGVQQ